MRHEYSFDVGTRLFLIQMVFCALLWQWMFRMW
jgi:hypothetical protein